MPVRYPARSSLIGRSTDCPAAAGTAAANSAVTTTQRTTYECACRTLAPPFLGRMRRPPQTNLKTESRRKGLPSPLTSTSTYALASTETPPRRWPRSCHSPRFRAPDAPRSRMKHPPKEDPRPLTWGLPVSEKRPGRRRHGRPALLLCGITNTQSVRCRLRRTDKRGMSCGHRSS